MHFHNKIILSVFFLSTLSGCLTSETKSNTKVEHNSSSSKTLDAPFSSQTVNTSSSKHNSSSTTIEPHLSSQTERTHSFENLKGIWLGANKDSSPSQMDFTGLKVYTRTPLLFHEDKTFIEQDSAEVYNKGSFVKKVLSSEITGNYSLQEGQITFSNLSCKQYNTTSEKQEHILCKELQDQKYCTTQASTFDLLIEEREFTTTNTSVTGSTSSNDPSETTTIEETVLRSILILNALNSSERACAKILFNPEDT